MFFLCRSSERSAPVGTKRLHQRSQTRRAGLCAPLALSLLSGFSILGPSRPSVLVSRTRRRPLWLTRGNGRSGLPASARSFLSSADRDWCHSSEMFGARCVATSVRPRRTEAATSPAVPESRNVGCSKDSPRMRKTGLPGPLSAGFRCQTPPFPLSRRGERLHLQAKVSILFERSLRGYTARTEGKVKDWDRIPQLLTTVDAADCTSAAGERWKRTRVGAGGAQPERPRRVE